MPLNFDATLPITTVIEAFTSTKPSSSFPFEMVLKKIVNAKNPSERSIALQSFKDLFLKTKIYKDEKDKQGVNRVQDAIKAIDNLTGSWS